MTPSDAWETRVAGRKSVAHPALSRSTSVNSTAEPQVGERARPWALNHVTSHPAAVDDDRRRGACVHHLALDDGPVWEGHRESSRGGIPCRPHKHERGVAAAVCRSRLRVVDALTAVPRVAPVWFENRIASGWCSRRLFTGATLIRATRGDCTNRDLPFRTPRDEQQDLSRRWWSDISSGPRTRTLSRRRVPDYPRRHRGRTRSSLTAKKPHFRGACAMGQGLEDDSAARQSGRRRGH